LPITFLKFALAIAGTVALISSVTTLWLGRPGWIPSALYSLGIPAAIFTFGFMVEKWGGLVERSSGDHATT
jgi:hypothetical protein